MQHNNNMPSHLQQHQPQSISSSQHVQYYQPGGYATSPNPYVQQQPLHHQHLPLQMEQPHPHAPSIQLQHQSHDRDSPPHLLATANPSHHLPSNSINSLPTTASSSPSLASHHLFTGSNGVGGSTSGGGALNNGGNSVWNASNSNASPFFSQYANPVTPNLYAIV
jgi:hypothetical protein